MNTPRAIRLLLQPTRPPFTWALWGCGLAQRELDGGQVLDVVTYTGPLWKQLESQFLWAPEHPRVLLTAQSLLVSFYFSQRADNRTSNNPVALNNVRFQGLELDARQSELNLYFFTDYLCLQAQLHLSVSSFAEGEDYLVSTMQSCYED